MIKGLQDYGIKLNDGEFVQIREKQLSGIKSCQSLCVWPLAGWKQVPRREIARGRNLKPIFPACKHLRSVYRDVCHAMAQKNPAAKIQLFPFVMTDPKCVRKVRHVPRERGIYLFLKLYRDEKR